MKNKKFLSIAAISALLALRQTPLAAGTAFESLRDSAGESAVVLEPEQPEARPAAPACPRQALHVFGGSGTHPYQNDLMFNLYKWAQPRAGCPDDTLEKRHYSGIEVMKARNIDVIRKSALDKICAQLKAGVSEIYLFGFSRGSMVAAALTHDITKVCGDNSGAVKFVGLLDPVNTSLPSSAWPASFPPALKERTLVVKKTVQQGAGLNETVYNQVFRWDPEGRIRVYGTLCLRFDEATGKLQTGDCGRAQQFIKEYEDGRPGPIRLADKPDLCLERKYFFGALSPFKTGECSGGPEQLFASAPERRGSILYQVDGRTQCLAAWNKMQEAGRDVVAEKCQPDAGWIPGILSTVGIVNTGEVLEVPNLWHQDLNCSLDVSEDKLEYVSNIKFVEDKLVAAARERGLNFPADGQRRRERCDPNIKAASSEVIILPEDRALVPDAVQ